MAAAADSSPSPLHIVIFPWLAFGHLVPCLELAERLAERGHRVSFVSTLRILSRLHLVAPALASLIDLVALPFPRVDGLPDGVEATCDLPPGKVGLLMEALDRLAPAFSAFLDAAKVDWVLLDNFHASIADVAAAEHKVPCILNLPYSAATARVMDQRKVGIKARKDKNDDAFLGDNIAAAIRAVMCEEETKTIFAANAKKMQEIVADDKCHKRYIDEFVQCLRTYKN